MHKLILGSSLVCLSLFFSIFSCQHDKALIVSGKPSKPLNDLLRILEIQHDNTLASIVVAVQKKQSQGGLLRGGAERWHLGQAEKKLEEKRSVLLPLFKQLEMKDALYPIQKKYDTCVFNPAWISEFRRRLQFLDHLWSKMYVRFDKIVILTGQRVPDPQKEGRKQLLKVNNKYVPFKKGWNFKGKLPKTETEMIKIILDQSQIPAEWGSKVSIEYADAPVPPGKLRTSTNDTIRYSCKQKQLTSGPLLALSSQPYRYQVSGLRTYLSKLFKNCLIDEVGPAAKEKETISTYCDSLGRWLWQEQERIKIANT